MFSEPWFSPPHRRYGAEEVDEPWKSVEAPWPTGGSGKAAAGDRCDARQMGMLDSERSERRLRVKDPLNFRLPTRGPPRAQIWGDRRKLRTAALKRSDPSTSHR